MSDEQNNNSGEGQNGGTDGQAHDGHNSGEGSKGNNESNAGNMGENGSGNNNNAALSQKQYEERIAELDKRDKAMDDKLKRMETLNDKITAEGKASGGQQQETKEQTQKKDLMKNFSDCIPGLDKMI